MLFVRRDYDGAKFAYSTLVNDFPESNFYLQSLYKLGWSQFKLAEHEDSLDPFFSLLALRLEGSDEDGTLRFTPNARRADRELVEDTLRVLSSSFSYMDGPESIDAYFDSVGAPDYAYLIYANLGSLYVDKERYEDAAGAFLAFVEREPLHPRSPLLEMAVIESWKQAGFPTRVLDAKQAFVERYGMDTAFWQQNDAAELPNVVAALKTNLTDLAQFYHARAQNPEPVVAQVEEAEKQTRIARQVRDDYRAAARWYRVSPILRARTSCLPRYSSKARPSARPQTSTSAQPTTTACTRRRPRRVTLHCWPTARMKRRCPLRHVPTGTNAV